MNRRELLKRSAWSLAAAGLGQVVPAAIGRTEDPLGASEPADAPPISPRRRPECLDLVWAKGTGLIWMAGETLFYENPRNRFMRFRRSFQVRGTPSRTELRLFADTHYIAWLNGTELGRGPGRSDHTWTFFDTYDVTPLLHSGPNTLAVLVLFQGFGTGGRQSIMQALLAHLTIDFTSGARESIVSDRSWRASPAEEFVRPSPRLHATLGCVEVQDGRRADDGWEQPGFNDTAWRQTDYIKPGVTNTPWYHFVPEPLPARQLAPIPFPRAVNTGHAALALPTVEELGAIRPAPLGGTSATWPLEVGTTSDQSPTVVTLDLGRVECGYLALEVSGPAGATLDLLCGEQLVAGRLPWPGSARVHTTRFILRGGPQTLQVAFNWIAFRFAQIWIWTPEPLTLVDGALRGLSLPLGSSGHFRCSDGFLNQLDLACEHTLRLCTQDGVVDSSSREQQQWIGDGRYTLLTLHHRFAVGTLHRRLIEQIGQGIDWLGSMVPRFPTGNLNVSPIPLYSLQWVLAFRDYVRFTGDEQLVRDWWPLIQHVLRWFTAFARADGLLERVPHWMYIDGGEGRARVPSIGKVNTTLNLHYLGASRFAAETAATLADRRAASHYNTVATILASSLRAALWDETIGAYRDSLDAAGRFGTLSEGTNAHALVFLEEPGTARAARILDAIFARPAQNPIRASPFTMNAVFAALSRHRRADLVFPMLPARYTAQVQSGAMWEHWAAHEMAADGTPVANSLSHAWGAGALAFLVNAVAGISPASSGWQSVLVAPQVGQLTSAEASVVTARGTVHVRWEITGGTFRLSVNLPSSIGGICRLPDGVEAAIAPGGGEFSCRV